MPHKIVVPSRKEKEPIHRMVQFDRYFFVQLSLHIRVVIPTLWLERKFDVDP